MAEFLLYGVFVDHVLGLEASGHYYDPTCICFGYWDHRSMSPEEARRWFANVAPQHVAVRVASYSQTPIDNYRALIGLD
jgi:hypothetical protein